MPQTAKTQSAPIKPKTDHKAETKKTAGFSAKVYDIDGSEIESIKLPKEIFGQSDSPKLLAHYIRVYLSNQRQGTQSTKTRGEITGSTRKIYRQKGTGRARHGDIKAPIFVGGGVAHGPKPRDFSLSINKKQKRKALYAAMSLKFKNGDIYFVQGLFKIEPKTKEMVKIINNLSLNKAKNLLLIYPKKNFEKVILAAGNLKNLDCITVKSINPYLLLKNQKIIFAREALPILQNFYQVRPD